MSLKYKKLGVRNICTAGSVYERINIVILEKTYDSKFLPEIRFYVSKNIR